MNLRKTTIALSFLLSMIVVANQAVLVLAAPVEISLDPFCCTRQYPVYGEEQPVRRGDGCVVTVDLEPIVDQENLDTLFQPTPQQQPEPGFIEEGLNNISRTPQSYSSAGESLSAPLRILYEALPVKQSLLVVGELFFDDHVELYHSFLDEKVFGRHIAKVSEYETSQQLADFLKTKEGVCDADNPRPNCVIEYAMCSYEKYAKVLFQQTGQSLANQAFNTSDIQTLLNVIQERDAALFHEAQQSQQALDTTIAVYSQFFNTYQLHLRFKDVIAALVKVRNMTSYMRTLVGCIPNKFIGVATTKCN